MNAVLTDEQKQEFLARGFSRRTLGRIAAMMTAGAALPFYNEPALAQLSKVSAPPDAVLINAGAWTHRSYCIRDALANLRVPVVELQMPNIHARETLKQPSLLAQVVKGQILGFGVDSYLLGLRAVVQAARSRHRSAGAHHRNTISLSKLRARPLSGSTKRSP